MHLKKTANGSTAIMPEKMDSLAPDWNRTAASAESIPAKTTYPTIFCFCLNIKPVMTARQNVAVSIVSGINSIKF